ncbi:MAG: hypothetical protein J6Y18_00510 [Candidatus Methanomethylophilaceae archaeon]|nr:hypothetical protein [Candidatus Methanomethylophilaceae archaeon]MBP5394380.1 hypothetical protein [Candidatus Methanomethylophilaceae archaeon]
MDRRNAVMVVAAFLMLSVAISFAVAVSDDSSADIIIHSDIPEEAGYEDWMFIAVAIFAVPLGIFIGLFIAFKIIFKDRD